MIKIDSNKIRTRRKCSVPRRLGEAISLSVTKYRKYVKKYTLYVGD